MNCERARERMVDRWISGLDEAERMEWSGHLAGCPECREQNALLDEMWNNLGAFPMEEPGRAMRSNLLHVLEAYRLGAESAARPKRSRVKSGVDWLSGLWPRQPLLQFAVAGLALVLGVAAGTLFTTRGYDQQRIAQLDSEVQQMRQLVALSLLQQQSASDRLRGVSWSVQVEPADAEVLAALITTLNYDPNVNVRLAAVDALKRLSANAGARRGLREAIAKQDSPLVQIALIDWVREAKDKAAVETLDALNRQPDVNPAVKERIERTLAQLH